MNGGAVIVGGGVAIAVSDAATSSVEDCNDELGVHVRCCIRVAAVGRTKDETVGADAPTMSAAAIA